MSTPQSFCIVAFNGKEKTPLVISSPGKEVSFNGKALLELADKPWPKKAGDKVSFRMSVLSPDDFDRLVSLLREFDEKYPEAPPK